MSKSRLPPTNFIIKDRIRQRAKEKGKVVMGTFYAYVDKLVAETVDNACHVMGERRNVDGRVYEAHLERIKKFAAQ